MCLITQQSKPIKVRKDHIVYKRLIKRFDEANNMYLASFFNNFRYDLNTLYQTDIKEIENSADARFFDDEVGRKYNLYLTNPEGILTVVYKVKHNILIAYGQGFHSVKKADRLKLRFSDECIVECTIPKGSLIYKDKTGLVISNQIIINKILVKLKL